MIVWLLMRIAQACGIMLVMTVLVFIGVHVIGDPTAMLVSPEASAQDRARMIAALGLDQPLWLQYLHFLGGILQGDIGNSFVFHLPAMGLILQRMPATLELAFCALLFALLIGVPLGLYCGLRPNTTLSKIIMTSSIVGFSIPTFWLGLMLILLFSVNLGWLPSSGRGETVKILGIGWSFLTLDGLSHLAMPAFTLSLYKVALVLRLVRAGVREIMPLEHVRFARAKGLSQRRVVVVHVLKNLMIPVVTVTGMEFGTLIAFSLVTETVFGWPGMGKLIIDSINLLDRPVMVAYLVIIVALFSAINIIVDILYMLLDPRIRPR
ncbi:ABC transporter permease [Acuticoccus mangrovi]|uniref:ABC transporter permease n=1 Tax=Acuticoccus mangrovi TaxID=2796142 RepID=A0A934MNR0_9HYPH|nr:ABC transporter permease [Acuticoccus mangrovi]MBJ3778424.1 ABC transporter permease [Acuticoccus mangrovi]